MTTIFAGTKHHDDSPHSETIEIDEHTRQLFHTIVHQDGTVAHEFTRTVSPEQLTQYLDHIPHWQARGYHTTDYTDAQTQARLAIHAKANAGPKQLTKGHDA